MATTESSPRNRAGSFLFNMSSPTSPMSRKLPSLVGGLPQLTLSPRGRANSGANLSLAVGAESPPPLNVPSSPDEDAKKRRSTLMRFANPAAGSSFSPRSSFRMRKAEKASAVLFHLGESEVDGDDSEEEDEEEGGGRSLLANLPRPTSLWQVLRGFKMREAFGVFLKKRLADENLDFFSHIERYEMQALGLSEVEDRRVKAMAVVSKFLAADTMVVNVSQRMRNEVVASITNGDCPSSVFEDIGEEMYSLMTTNFFHDFVMENFGPA